MFQVHPNYKPESQYQQYHPSQIPKYNMPNIPSQCRKYPPHENEFLAKLQRINPSMARSIISDHHMRDPQAAYSGMDQARMYQNQRYFPNPMQNNPSYNYHNIPQPYYPSSCNYPRSNQMSVGGAQYPGINQHSERSLSPRNMNMGMNYGAPPQKVSPNYGQYNPPEYAQHYQHRRASMPPQEYYQQSCRTTAYMPPHQLPPETADNRPSSGIRHFIENWAEEEGPGESLAPIFKESVRLHNDASNEHVFVIESSAIPQLENVALVPTENGQYIIKSGIDNNSIVRIEKPNEDVTERAVNLQIIESNTKTDCMLLNENLTNEETANPVPYKENQINTNCDEKTILNEPLSEAPIVEKPQQTKKDTIDAEPSVIVCNEVSVIKDMPLIDEPLTLQVEEHRLAEILEPEITNNTEKEKALTEEKEKTIEEREERIVEEKQVAEDKEKTAAEHIEKLVPEVKELATSEEKEAEEEVDDDDDDDGDNPAKILEKELLLTENHITSSTKRTQRIFSVDDIINTAGAISSQTRRNSLQLIEYFDNSSLSKEDEDKDEQEEDKTRDKTENQEEKTDEHKHGEEEVDEEATYTNAISVEENSIILEIGGALVQLNLNHYNGTKVLSVLPLSESLVIDVNGNLQDNLEAAKLSDNETAMEREEPEEKLENSNDENLEDKHENQCDILQEDISQSDSTKDDPIVEETTTLTLEDEINGDVYHSEVIIGDESSDNDIFINLESTNETHVAEINIQETIPEPIEETVRKEVMKKSKYEQFTADEEAQKVAETDYNEIEIPEEVTFKVKEEIAEESETIEEKLEVFETTIVSEANIIEEPLVQEKLENISIKIESLIIKESDPTPLEERFTEKLVKPIEVIKKKEKRSSRDEKKKSKERSEEKKKSSSSLKIMKGDEKHKKTSKRNGDTTSKSEKKSKSESTLKLSKTINQDKKESDIRIEKKVIKEILPQKGKHVEKEKPVEKEKRVEKEKHGERQKHLEREKSVEEEKPVEKEIPVEREKPIIHHFSTKAAKKLYENDILLQPVVPIVEKKTLKRKSKIEEAVNKIKLLKKEPEIVKVDKLTDEATSDKEETPELVTKDVQKSIVSSDEDINILGINDNKEAIPLKVTKPCKRVTFSLDTEIREMGKEEMDRKKLSWEEYHSRKRKAAMTNYEWGESTSKIMEDTVSSTKEISDDVVEEVALSIEKEIETSTLSKSPPRVLVNNWEDPDSPEMTEPSSSSRQKKCFIDINEFSIKPIESVSTPSPVSSSQFSYHSEDDSLQVYKNVVDSKLNSLNITIPKKVNKPKPVEHFSVLFERFLNKGTLNGSELEKVRKIIELKRKMIEEQQLTYEVRAERELKDLKLHLKKVPEKRKHKRFRNLYAADTSDDDSDSSQSEKEICDYSVYQRNSQQGVPKLIIKRKSGLPQPFVKLERSHAVDLLAKKRKLY